MAEIYQYDRFDDVPNGEPASQPYEELPGQFGMGLPGINSYVWHKWVTGALTQLPGQHTLFLRLPPNFRFGPDEPALRSGLVIDAPEPQWLTDKLTTGDPSAIVSQLGVAGEDPLCTATVDLFCAIYGAEAGNLALKCVAVGGVFLGGGIAPKMLPALQRGAFMHGFTDKGRFSELAKSFEVSVALNPRAPLLGAAYYALRL